ncbi:MAG TPA: GntR family transcriptional regulator [Thermodesulfobacteriota bacterium]|nr:GntR family transcriptional regulator [Thermodesulfobacteriota bacterium]
MSPPFRKKEFSPRYSQPLVEQISEFLTQAIMEGQFTSGERLVENELQRRFGVSRTPIRESFRILEKKGLIQNIPRKGTYVRKITRKDIEENFPVRANLESLAAILALPYLTPQDLEKMESCFARMSEAGKHNDFRSYLKYHTQYHDVFIRASHNDTLIELLENLRNQAIWFRYSYLYVQEAYDYAVKVHRRILDDFINKDSNHLESLIREHILIALDRFVQFLNSKE